MKSYSFSVRHWEVEQVDSLNFSDSFGLPIYVEYMNISIERIMPKISKNYSGIYDGSNWLLDRCRFYIDVLSLGQLNDCFILVNDSYKKIDWSIIIRYFSYLRLFHLIFRNRRIIINYFVNNDVDSSSLIYMKNLFMCFTFSHYYSFSLSENIYLNIDLSNDYLLEGGRIFFDYISTLYTNILLIGYNIRCEHPLFSYQSKDFCKIFTCRVYIFGFMYELFGDKFISLGFTLADFINISYSKINVYGKNYIFKYSDKVSMCIILGSALLDNYYYNFYNSYITIFEKKFQKFKASRILVKKIFFSIIDLNAIYVGFKFDFRLCSYSRLLDIIELRHSCKENKLFYILNCLNFFESSFSNLFCFSYTFCEHENNLLLNNHMFRDLNCITIYLGNYYSGILERKVDKVYNKIYLFDLILPITYFYERDVFLSNLSGITASASFIYIPKVNSKNVIDIYLYLFQFFVSSLFIQKSYRQYRIMNLVQYGIFFSFYFDNFDKKLFLYRTNFSFYNSIKFLKLMYIFSIKDFNLLLLNSSMEKLFINNFYILNYYIFTSNCLYPLNSNLFINNLTLLSVNLSLIVQAKVYEKQLNFS